MLLILAGVSLSLVAGGDGILGRAETAVKTHNEAQIKEEIELGMAQLITDYYDERYSKGTFTGTEEEYITGKTVETANGSFTVDENGKITYTGSIGSATGKYDFSTGKVTLDGEVKPGEENAKYTVTYNANGGTGSVPTDSQEYADGATVTVDFSTVPTHEQGTFLGWATTPNATKATYTSAGTTSFTMGTADVTLYAVYEYTQAYHSEHPELHIPTGFAHTEGTVSEGYVIVDSEGNEFVWIPVASSSAYTKKLGTNNNYVKNGSSGTDTANSLNNDITQAVKGDTLGVSSILGETVNATLDANQPESAIVNAAGGFWVGRYEAGIPNTAHSNIAGLNGGTKDTTSANSSNTYWETQKANIVVKQNSEPVRNITQTKALSIANSWKSGAAGNGTVAFQSGLITGSRVGCNV